MVDETFQQALVELYQGEVLGEIIFDQMLGYFSEPDHKRKVAAMLQLETETKARLRPVLLQAGLDIAEGAGVRSNAMEIAASMQGKSWKETMTNIRDIVTGALVRYQEIADNAPAQHQAIANYMVGHECSLLDFATLELAGDSAGSLASISAQLEHKV